MSRFLHGDKPLRHARVTRARRRRGLALVLALLCLVVSVSFMANIARQIRLDQRQRNGQQRQLQTTWLARLGLELAAQRALEDPSYSGGTWQITVPNVSAQPEETVVLNAKVPNAKVPNANDLAGNIGVVVRRNPADQLTIQVTAKYPYGTSKQIIKTLTATIPSAMNNTGLEL